MLSSKKAEVFHLLFLNKKGQASFELLLVVLIVFSVAVFATGLVIQESNSITALSITKSESIKFLEEQEEAVIILEMSFEETDSGISISIFTDPSDFTAEDMSVIEQKVVESTSYETVAITFNPAAPV